MRAYGAQLPTTWRYIVKGGRTWPGCSGEGQRHRGRGGWSSASLVDQALQSPQVRLDFGAFVALFLPALQGVVRGLQQGDGLSLVQANAVVSVLVRHSVPH